MVVSIWGLMEEPELHWERGSSELLHPLSGIIGIMSEGRPQQSLSPPRGTKNQGLEVLCAVLLTCRTVFGMGWSLASSAFHPSLKESSDREAGHQDLPSYKHHKLRAVSSPNCSQPSVCGSLGSCAFLWRSHAAKFMGRTFYTAAISKLMETHRRKNGVNKGWLTFQLYHSCQRKRINKKVEEDKILTRYTHRTACSKAEWCWGSQLKTLRISVTA